jgi:hypothetical protein
MSINSKCIIICIFFIEDSICYNAPENKKFNITTTFDAFDIDYAAPAKTLPVYRSICRGTSFFTEIEISGLKASSVEVLKYQGP